MVGEVNEAVRERLRLTRWHGQAALVLLDQVENRLCSKTLTDAVLAAGSLLMPVVGAQRKELLAGGYIQADCHRQDETGPKRAV